MKKQWMAFAAVMTALSISACSSGDGIVINGTVAAEAGSGQEETSGDISQETKAGTTIEIVTDDTIPAAETQPAEEYGQEEGAEAAQPETESVSQAEATQAASTQPAATQAASATQPAATQAASATQPAAQTYKVTDVKKTMYATASVRVRSSYSTSSSVLAGLAQGEKVEVTGESENGWLRVSYKGNVGYVSKSYLTEEEPESSAQTSSAGQTAGTGTGNAQETGSASSGGTAPTTAASESSSSGKVGPGAGGSSGNTSSSGTAAGPGQESSAAGPSVSESSASASAPSGSSGNSVTGSVTALDPSGVTIQTSNGTTYQFVWGTDVPALAPGEKIQIFYETTSSGERRVISYTK